MDESASPEVKNGAIFAPARIKFGPLDTQDVPAEWAETMLSELFATNKSLFGRLLIVAAGARK